MGSNDKLVLYTAVRCPCKVPMQTVTNATNTFKGAHRVHIALSELNIPYEQELIDLDKPRSEAYLKVNPRGLVPTLLWNGETITESGIVAQFLADAYPSHLVPPSGTAEGALRRARIASFVDTFQSKFRSHLHKFSMAKNDEDASAGLEAAVAGLVKDVEPLLADAKPFFGGAEKLTLAEVGDRQTLAGSKGGMLTDTLFYRS